VRIFVAGLVLVLAACGPPPAPAAIPQPVADPGAATDPINTTDAPLLFRHAQSILDELIAALPPDQRARVSNMALYNDDRLGDVNAYATCDQDGSPLVAISNGLLTIAAHVAMSSATDEQFETDLERDYFAWMQTHGLAPPPVQFYAPAYHSDRRKVARQREIFDEQIAFILGHELAHHYLGHLACNSRGRLEELGQVAADNVPAFNQIAELAADAAAIKNLLAAGERRVGYAWTEAGALHVIAAFNRHHAATPTQVLFAFERTHPLPQVRAPLITVAADLWRGSGGRLPL
jgi:hypothetical protein